MTNIQSPSHKGRTGAVKPASTGRPKSSTSPNRRKSSTSPNRRFRSAQTARRPGRPRLGTAYLGTKTRRLRPGSRAYIRRQMILRRRRIIAMLAGAGVALVIFIVILCLAFGKGSEENTAREDTLEISEEVRAYEPLLSQYAQEYGVEEYTQLLLAIMQVESSGQGNDVMQASESLGLAVNSLMPEASIEQGCRLFSQLLSYGEGLGCDLNSVIQAYNFGITYLDYVAENGKKHTFSLAEAFAGDMSGGETVVYENSISVEENGGWRYAYGNMFYVDLVRQYWSES